MDDEENVNISEDVKLEVDGRFYYSKKVLVKNMKILVLSLVELF